MAERRAETDQHAQASVLPGFFAVEGLDGAGTTTQAALTAERLRRRGVPCFQTREPTGGPIGRFIRELLASRQPISGTAFALLFAADRAEHCRGAGGIFERRGAGQLVISDRCIASSLAYQGLEVPPDFVEAVNRAAALPERVVFLDTPIEVCQRRLRARGAERQRFDDMATQRRLLASYDDALDRLRARGVAVRRIDGRGGPQAVFARLWPLLEVD